MRKNLKRMSIAAAVLLAAAVAAQAVRPGSPNPPADASHAIQAQPGTSSALVAVLDRSCGDCHSATMAPRWYTRIPPFSMVMARAATDGRKVLDFSDWTAYSPEQQRSLLIASCKDVTSGTMPGNAYLSVRRDARLSTQDVETICSAARQATTAATPARRAP